MNNIFLQNTRVLEIIESEKWCLEKFVTSAKQNITKKGGEILIIQIHFQNYKF